MFRRKPKLTKQDVSVLFVILDREMSNTIGDLEYWKRAGDGQIVEAMQGYLSELKTVDAKLKEMY